MIAYIGALNKRECIPYKIIDGSGLNKKVVITKEWQKFISDNFVTISGWIEIKKVRYLQNRNPDVPEIIFKLEAEKDKQRKLKYVRELWNLIPMNSSLNSRPCFKNHSSNQHTHFAWYLPQTVLYCLQKAFLKHGLVKVITYRGGTSILKDLRIINF